jgi:hypothetical protein
MYLCLIHSYMFRHFKIPSSGSPIWTCWDGAQCHGKQRRMEAVYCDSLNIQLPSFSAFHDIGNHLIMFIFDSLIMAFLNAETCRSTLSTNTLNRWCICWSFPHFMKIHGSNCKKLEFESFVQQQRRYWQNLNLSHACSRNCVMRLVWELQQSGSLLCRRNAEGC